MPYGRPLPQLPLPADPSRGMGVYFAPSEAFADELSEALRGQRVLEIFAGNGLLAGMLARRGVDIVATSVLSGIDNHERGLYHPVMEMEASEAIRELGAERDVLLMSWPNPSRSALRACEAWGVDRPLVYIGEVTNYELGHLGGCACDEFFSRLITLREFQSYSKKTMEKALLGALGPPTPQPSREPARRPSR